MHDIQQWLNSFKDYDAGVRLYLKYGRDKALIALFTREACTDFKKKKLEAVLGGLYKNYKHPTTPQAALDRLQREQNPATAFKTWPAQPIADPVLLALYNQWKPLYQEMMGLQARAYEIGIMARNGDSNQKREAAVVCLRILELDDACDELYAKRDYYYAYGRLPDVYTEASLPVVEPMAAARQYQNVMRYLREHRTKLEKQSSHRLAAKWAARIIELEKEKKELMITLKINHD